jgi:hypothetical protein
LSPGERAFRNATEGVPYQAPSAARTCSHLAIDGRPVTIIAFAGRLRELARPASDSKDLPMQKSKARRKAAKVRRKRVQNTHFKTRRVSTKERFK